MASTYLSRSISSTGNRKTSTWSAWIKKSAVSGEQVFINFNATLNFYTDGTSLRFNSGEGQFLYTSALQRDVNGWYHFVGVIDTTQATESDRIKLYINGELQTAFSNSTYPTQNSDLDMNVSGTTCYVGSSNGSSDFNGLMAHVHWIDGTAYDADDFGQTQTSSGIWKPNPNPSVTYGTNGFFLKFQDSSSLGDDSSGNTNDFTMSGTGTQTLDTPTNVFATLNPLWRSSYNPVFSNGNLRMATPAVNQFHNSISTLGASSGKWYLEMKCNGSPNSANYFGIGNEDEMDEFSQASTVVGTTTQGFSLRLQNGNKRTNGTDSSYGSAFADGDIMMYAMDLDNGKVWFGKNGTWFNSGDPAAGTNEAFSGLSGTFFIGGSVYNGGFSSVDFNYGNGYFGTTAVASANSDTAGLGQFEYSVPSGYYALCTKNIAEYG